MSSVRVLAVRTYPRRGKPPVGHEAAVMTAAGLEGDRTKKAPVSMVGRDAPDTRANLVLDASTVDVEALDGAVLRIGAAIVVARRTGNSCRGLYASVRQEGRVAVGDVVLRTQPDD
ncbi:MAG: hypothetical protein ACRCY9_05490 [Phycicoccus sp.]